MRKILGIVFPLYGIALFLLWMFEYHVWVWMGIAVPIIIVFSFFGSVMAFRPQLYMTAPTQRTRIILSLIFLGIPVVLLILTMLMILGILPYPVLRMHAFS
ncbi:hypothetical protein E3J49_02985 [Candidatus Bathyarchaeota archaeon]|nr:MAG: hypothetical protein E3J49_02985 [Candidatus Bathyarchaeota archaeon]